MQKRLGFFALAFVAVLLAAPLAGAQVAAGGYKIAFIDSRVIMDQAPGRAQLAEQFSKEMAPLEARLVAMADSDAAMIKKFTDDEPTMTPEQRASRSKEINDKRTAWRARSDSINGVANARREALEAPMRAILEKIISDTRAEEGYWMILDLAANPGFIVALDKNMDITDRILSKYKTAVATMPPGAPSPAAGGPVNSATGVGRVIPPAGL
jgi:Skp family chaperone for outer membrane proteins